MKEKYKQLSNELGANGYEFETSKYISKGWGLGTSIIGYFILFILVNIAINIAAGLIPLIGAFINSLVVAPAISAGFIVFIHNKHKTGQSNFGLIFSAFNKVGDLIVLKLITGVISILLFIPAIISLLGIFSFEDLMAVASQDPQALKEVMTSILSNIGEFYGVMSISFLLMMVFGMFMIFTTYFIVLGDLKAIESIKASIELVKKNFFPILGFGILLVLINLGGMLALGIGIFVSMPVSIAAMYIMFYEIIGKKVEEGETVGVPGEDVLDA